MNIDIVSDIIHVAKRISQKYSSQPSSIPEWVLQYCRENARNRNELIRGAYDICLCSITNKDVNGKQQLNQSSSPVCIPSNELSSTIVDNQKSLVSDLDIAIINEDVEKINITLSALKNLPVTIETLRISNVVARLKELRSHVNDQSIKTDINEVIHYWKNVVTGNLTKTDSRPVTKSSKRKKTERNSLDSSVPQLEYITSIPKQPRITKREREMYRDKEREWKMLHPSKKVAYRTPLPPTNKTTKLKIVNSKDKKEYNNGEDVRHNEDYDKSSRNDGFMPLSIQQQDDEYSSEMDDFIVDDIDHCEEMKTLVRHLAHPSKVQDTFG